jgi:transposase InsO family protein
MDAKESVIVPGVGATTFNQARDEFGRATVMNRVHPADREDQRTVKLTGTQVQQDGRLAFTQWGLPDAIQTDRATIFVDGDPTPFPTRLVLWWVGLGIEHRLIPRHTPQRNGSVERSHRTLDERTLIGQQFNGADQLQQRVDADWSELNAECPSRARGCKGQPPLVAHPELLVPRRAYRPEQERERFALARVDTYLATQTWIRIVSQVGQITLGSQRYGLGVAWAGQTVSIHFEVRQRPFVFTQVKPATKRGREVQELTVETLTGRPALVQEETTP